jgi:predicted SAM-dependent methyltransferase
METGLKIEFGSQRKMAGWNCHDIEVPIEKPLPYGDGVAEIVFCSHVIEHVTTHESLAFFKEVRRILKPGGVFRIIVPVLDRITDRKHAESLILGHGHKAVFAYESLVGMLFAAGFDRERICETEKHPLDNHADTIGEEMDSAESMRVEAIK